MLFIMLIIQIVTLVVFIICAEFTSPLYLFKKWYTILTIIMYVAIIVFFFATGMIIGIGIRL